MIRHPPSLPADIGLRKKKHAKDTLAYFSQNVDDQERRHFITLTNSRTPSSTWTTAPRCSSIKGQTQAGNGCRQETKLSRKWTHRKRTSSRNEDFPEMNKPETDAAEKRRLTREGDIPAGNGCH